MPCLVDVAGPVLLGLNGFEGARVLRKICSVATWAAYWRFAHLVRLFSLAVSASALALIPSPHQLHCGIMIRTVSKEL